MAKKRLTPQDRTALVEWEELIASIRENSDINPSDTEAEIRARRERLEKDDEEWFRYYFAMYYSCEARTSTRKPPEGWQGTTGGTRYAHGRGSWRSPHGP